MAFYLIPLWVAFFGVIYYANYNRFLECGERHADAMKYSALTNSFVHAIISSGCAMMILYDLFDRIHIYSSTTPIFGNCIAVTVGYFILDFIYVVKTIDKSNMKSSIMYMVHHIVFTLLCLWAMYINRYHSLSAFYLFVEFSTIILNIHQYFKYKAKYHFARKVSFNDEHFEKCIKYDNYAYLTFIIFTIVFFSVRISNTLIATMFYYNQMIENKWLIMSAVGFSTVLNMIWLTHIISMLKNYRFIRDSKKLE
jgi:hypothetical protein